MSAVPSPGPAGLSFLATGVPDRSGRRDAAGSGGGPGDGFEREFDDLGSVQVFASFDVCAELGVGQVLAGGTGSDRCVAAFAGETARLVEVVAVGRGATLTSTHRNTSDRQRNSAYQCSSAHRRKLSSVSCPASQL